MSQRDIDPLTCPACGARLLHNGLPGRVWCPNGDYHSGRNILRQPTVMDVLRLQFRKPLWRAAAWLAGWATAAAIVAATILHNGVQQ